MPIFSFPSANSYELWQKIFLKITRKHCFGASGANTLAKRTFHDYLWLCYTFHIINLLVLFKVLGIFLLRKFLLGKFHLENSSYGKFFLRCFGATLFRSWLASLEVGLRTLASQVRAQRHSRIACYIVFRHRKILRKIKFASLFCSYVVSELARFARGRIEDSSLTGSRPLHCFTA